MYRVIFNFIVIISSNTFTWYNRKKKKLRKINPQITSAMLALTIQLCVLVSCSQAIVPKMCQQTHGLSLYRKTTTSACLTDNTTRTQMKVILQTRDYTQYKMESTVVSIYEKSCTLYTSFFGGVTQSTELIAGTIDMLSIGAFKAGFCPFSTDHPIQLSAAPADVCKGSWLRTVTTLQRYCLMHQSSVYVVPGDFITSVDLPATRCLYHDGHCTASRGKLVYWVSTDTSYDQQWKEAYSGTGLLAGRILTIGDIQGALKLTEDYPTSLYPGWTSWINTIEGYRVKLLPKTNGRGIRNVDADMTRVLNTTRSDLLSKLQYLSETLLPPLTSLESICEYQRIHDDTARSSKDSEYYYRIKLNNPYLRIREIDHYLLAWPCKPITEWHPTPNITDCYVDLPVTYMDDSWKQGFMNTVSGDIYPTSPIADCKISTHYYIKDKLLYIHEGRTMSHLSIQHALPLPAGRTSPAWVPVWENQWITNASVYNREDITSEMISNIQSTLSTLTVDPPDSTNQLTTYLSNVKDSITSYGVAGFTMWALHIVASVGGFLYSCILFSSLYRGCRKLIARAPKTSTSITLTDLSYENYCLHTSRDH
nr:MAG: glycoprotein [Beetle nyamivirus]